MARLPKHIEKLSTDDINKNILEPHNLDLIKRILNFGDANDFSWLCENFSQEKIIKFIQTMGKTHLNKKSYNFWSKYFGTEYSLEDFTRRTKSSSREDIWY